MSRYAADLHERRKNSNEDINEPLLKRNANFHKNIDGGGLLVAELPLGAATVIAAADHGHRGVEVVPGDEAEDREEEDSMFTSYRISYCSDSDDAEEEDDLSYDEDGLRGSMTCCGEAEDDVARLNAKYRGSGPAIQDLRKRLDVFYFSTSDDEDEDPNGAPQEMAGGDTPCGEGAAGEESEEQQIVAQMLRVQSLPEPASSISTPFQTGYGQSAAPAAGSALATPPVPRSGSGKKRLQPAEAAEPVYSCRPRKLLRSKSCL